MFDGRTRARYVERKESCTHSVGARGEVPCSVSTPGSGRDAREETHERRGEKTLRQQVAPGGREAGPFKITTFSQFQTIPHMNGLSGRVMGVCHGNLTRTFEKVQSDSTDRVTETADTYYVD